MKNLVKYSVFGSLVFTGSVASAWWCSTCGEDHKDGAVCQKTGTKPCDRCRGIHKPGKDCPQVFRDDRDVWKGDLETPGSEESPEEKKKREALKRKKAFDELEKKTKELKPNEVELSRLLSSVQDRAEELGVRIVHGDDGRLEIIPGYNNNQGYGCARGYNNNQGYGCDYGYDNNQGYGC